MASDRRRRLFGPHVRDLHRAVRPRKRQQNRFHRRLHHRLHPARHLLLDPRHLLLGNDPRPVDRIARARSFHSPGNVHGVAGLQRNHRRRHPDRQLLQRALRELLGADPGGMDGVRGDHRRPRHRHGARGRLRNHRAGERAASESQEEHEPVAGIRRDRPERSAALGGAQLFAIRRRQCGHHGIYALSLHIRPEDAQRVFDSRRHRLRRGLGDDAALPAHQPSRAPAQSLPGRPGHAHCGVCALHPVLEQRRRCFHRPRAVLRPRDLHSDDGDTFADGFGRVRPAEDRKARRGRHAFRAADARQDRRRGFQQHRRLRCDRRRDDQRGRPRQPHCGQHPNIQNGRVLRSSRLHRPLGPHLHVQGDVERKGPRGNRGAAGGQAKRGGRRGTRRGRRR